MMARLSAKRRKRMRAGSFAIPSERKYPIDTKNRARNALARVAQHGTASEKAKVRAAVRRRFPSIAVGGVKTKGKRRRSRK